MNNHIPSSSLAVPQALLPLPEARCTLLSTPLLLCSFHSGDAPPELAIGLHWGHGHVGGFPSSNTGRSELHGSVGWVGPPCGVERMLGARVGEDAGEHRCGGAPMQSCRLTAGEGCPAWETRRFFSVRVDWKKTYNPIILCKDSRFQWCWEDLMSPQFVPHGPVGQDFLSRGLLHAVINTASTSFFHSGAVHRWNLPSPTDITPGAAWSQSLGRSTTWCCGYAGSMWQQ